MEGYKGMVKICQTCRNSNIVNNVCKYTVSNQRFLIAAMAVILFGFIIISTGCVGVQSNQQQQGVTIAPIDSAGKLGYGTFVFSDGWNMVKRITIGTQNQCQVEGINIDGKVNWFITNYTIKQISSPKDEIYIIIQNYDYYSIGTTTAYEEYKGRYYLELETNPVTFLLDNGHGVYYLFENNAGTAVSAQPFSFASSKPNPCYDCNKPGLYEIYVMAYYTGSISHLCDIKSTDDNWKTYTEIKGSGKTVDVFEIRNPNLDAWFEKTGTGDTMLVAILYDTRSRTIVDRVTTKQAHGRVSLKA